MTQYADIIKLLDETSCSQKHLTKHDDNYLPIYSVQAFEEANKKLHLGPYSAEEKFLMMSAKVRADVMGEQSRMDAVWTHERGGTLLIGNKFAAEDAHYLHLHGVTHLLNTANNLNSWDFVNPCKEQLDQYQIALKNYKMNDIETAQIREHFYDTSHWINDAFNQNEAKVLVTCWQGASRSATVALAYLLKCGGLSLSQAVTRVRQHRDIRPNNGFISQLIEFEQQCMQQIN